LAVYASEGLRKRYFLKKDAKTFAPGVLAEPAFAPWKQEFFGSFFQKRTRPSTTAQKTLA
jgi:hypothetical protein